MEYSEPHVFCFALILLAGIQHAVGKAEPFISQSGVIPKESSPTPVEEQPVAPPEKTDFMPVLKRKEASTSEEKRFNMLLNSFPTEEPLATSPTDTYAKEVIPEIKEPQEVLSSQTFYFNPSPSAIILMESSSPPPFEEGRKPAAIEYTAPKVSFVEEPHSRHADNNFHKKSKAGGKKVLPNRLKDEAIEKEIFSESLKENINRQVLNQAPNKSSISSIDSNLIQRQAETSKNENPHMEEDDALFEHASDVTGRAGGGGKIPFYKPGAPWEDEKIVGKMMNEMQIAPIEISFKVATKLCLARKKSGHLPEFANKGERYYLWAPITQYIPLIHKGYPIRPPVFAPHCLKWVLRQCRGDVRRPLVRPCTYWAPMPIRRPECGFLPNMQTKIVNYRPLGFGPGNCPCVWPCTRRFDAIQRCRIETPKREKHMDAIHSDGDPWHEGELRIQDILVAQLCRGMKTALTSKTVIPIGWIPLRIDGIDKSESNQMFSSSQGETPSEHDNVLQFRKKREASPPVLTNKMKRKRSIGPSNLDIHSDASRKKRQLGPTQAKRYYNPDAVVDSAKLLAISGRSLTAPNQELEVDDDEEDLDPSFAALVPYDPEQYAYRGNDSLVDAPPRCIEWRYKACPKGKSSEEIHNSLFGEEAKDDEEGTKGLSRRSARRRSRRRMHNSRRTFDGSKSSTLNKRQTFNRQEGSGRLNKRHDDDETDFFNVLGAQGDMPGAGCGEWHFTETSQCMQEEIVGIAGRISQIMLTGVIDSNESDEDDDYIIEAGGINGEVKTVKDLCPGSPNQFPCFLKRRKRDAKSDETTSDKEEDSSEVNVDANEDDKEDTQGEVETETEEETEIVNSPEVIAEEIIEPKEEDQDTQMSSAYFANHIQIPPDSACMCDWPCLPFFDKINRCYDGFGGVINSKRHSTFRSFRRTQRAPVLCINFVEIDEIYCKIKEKQ